MVSQKARDLRTFQTDAERRLWSILRGRRLQSYKFRRQRPVGPFILDFACIEYRVAIEADGGQHADNAADERRTAWLEERGWRVMRFWNNDILRNSSGVADTIVREMMAMSKASPSNPHPPAAAQRAPSPACGRGALKCLAASLVSLYLAVSHPALAATTPEMEALIKAAQQEGSVVLDGPPLEKAREAITAGFAKRYGITVNYVSSGGPRSAARVRAERAAGRYLVDVFLTGPDTVLLTAKPAGWLDKIEPALVDPEVTDGSKWKDGHLWFGDPDHTILRVLAFVTPTVAVNAKLTKADEIRSYKDLLDSKWQGKMIAKDPTVTGAGASLISYLYLNFGPDYVRDLYQKQKPFVSRDARQAAQSLAQGAYPIWIGPDVHESLHLKSIGYPIEFVFPGDGPKVLSGGYGFLSLINKAPHPNAAKLLINWLAGPEGEKAYAESSEFVSLRTDIAQDWAPDVQRLHAGDKYLDTMSYAFVTEQRDSAFEKVRKLLDF